LKDDLTLRERTTAVNVPVATETRADLRDINIFKGEQAIEQKRSFLRPHWSRRYRPFS
jgi:hypothetical protein